MAVGLAGVTAVVAVGCSGDDTGGGGAPDSSTKDSGKDASAETGPKPDTGTPDTGPGELDSGTDTSTPIDTGTDAPHDAVADVAVDTGVDAAKDTGIDAPVDTGTDTSLPVDAGIDTGIDATIPDAGIDTGLLDAGTDAADSSSGIDFNHPVQIDVSAVLTANVVVTTTPLGGFALTPMDRSNWDFPTQSKAAQLSADPNGLPDNAFFAADSPTHPAVQLHWNNVVNQFNGRVVSDATPFSFNVSQAVYNHIQFFGLSTEGPTTISIVVTYTDNSTTLKSAAIADWFNNPTADQFVLIDGLDRIQNGTTYENANNPGIFGVDVAVDNTKVVKQVTITNTATGWYVFYGATAF